MSTQPRNPVLRWLRSAFTRADPTPLPRWQEATSIYIPNTNVETTTRTTPEQQLSAYTGYVYAAAGALASDVRANEWNIWRVDDPMDESTWEPQPPHPILMNPNDTLTAGTLFELWSLHKDLTGTFYLSVLSDTPGGPAYGLQIIYPHWVDRTVQEEATGRLMGWMVNPPGREVRVIPSADLLFDRYPHPYDPLRGASPVEAFAVSYDMDLYARAYGAGLMKNNAIPSVVINTKSPTLTPQQADDIREAWKARYAGRSAEVGVLPRDSSITTLSLGMRDAGFLELASLSKDQILQIYKVPPSKLGDVKDGVSRANAEALNHTYNENALYPRLMRIEEALNNRLLERLYPTETVGRVPGGLVFKFVNPIQADKDFMASNAHEAFKAGALPLGRYLKQLGIDSDDDEDVMMARYVPTSVRVVRDEELLSAPPPPAEPPPPDQERNQPPPQPPAPPLIPASSPEAASDADAAKQRAAHLRSLFSSFQTRSLATNYERTILPTAELVANGLNPLDERLYPLPHETASQYYERLKSSVAKALALEGVSSE